MNPRGAARAGLLATLAAALLSVSLTSSSAQDARQSRSGSFAGVWDWRAPHAELTLVIHQQGQKIDGTITAAARDGNRVSAAEFTGTVAGTTAGIEWWLGGRQAGAPADGTATLNLSGGSLGWMSRYHGDDEVWFPDQATLTPKAAAASFDCTKATRPLDKLICADPKLSAADERLAAAYAQAQSQLSDEGKRLLVEGQRSWLKYLPGSCALDKVCVESAYGERIKALKDAVAMVGPYRFQSVDSYAVKDLGQTSIDGSGPALTRIVASYPRIDDPVTPEATRWNELARQRVETILDRKNINDEVDDTISFSVAYASKDAISLFIHQEIYAHGAHAEPSDSGYTVLLASGRSLDGAALFDTRRPWKDFLAQQVYDALAQDADENDWELFPKDAAEIAAKVADEKHWTVASDGLVVFFSPYEVANYASGPHEVTIDWPTLEPYLASPPPFPIPPRADESPRTSMTK